MAANLQIGKLTPEDAERLAANFRPIWELDDAPFAQGNGLSTTDIDALAAGAGVASSVRGTLERQPQTLAQQEPKTEVQQPQPVHSTPAPRVPAPEEPKVEIAIDIAPEPTPPPAQVAQAVPQSRPPVPERRPYAAPRPPPAVIKMRDVEEDYAPSKSPTKGSSSARASPWWPSSPSSASVRR